MNKKRERNEALKLNRRKLRIAWLKEIPWLEYLETAEACDGMRWSHMPLYALYGSDHPKRQEAWDRHKCKAPAKWKFKAFKSRRKRLDNGDWADYAKSGTYCWQHLVNQLTYHNVEDERMRQWEKDHPITWRTAS